MTDPIRVAAKAMLDAHYHDGDVGAAAARLLAALSAPQPAADERVAEHIRTVAKACAASCSVGIATAMNRDQIGAAYVEESAALAAVESSARALLAAGREEVAALQERIAELDDECETRGDGVRVRKDRWQTGIRRIVALLWGNRHEFEIDEVVERVRLLLPNPLNDDEALVKTVLDRAASHGLEAPSNPTTQPPEGR